MKKNPLLIQSDIDKILDDAWLNIVVNPKTLFNPLGYIPPELENEPHLYILWLLSRPEYFSFFCSEILNIRILPFQAVILRELWVRKFPMLIASRGGGKSYLLALYSILRMIFLPGRRIILCGAGFRQSKIIFQYMETIWKNAPLLRDMVGTQGNGASHEPDMYSFKIGDSTTLAIPIGCLAKDSLITTNEGIRTLGDYNETYYPNGVWSDKSMQNVGFYYDSGITPTIKITTKRGYSYIGTYNHKMKIVRNNQIVWCRTDEMLVGDYILLDRTERWFNPTFECNEDQAYCLGCMIGDGSYVRKDRLQFTTKDPEFLSVLDANIGKFKQQKDKLHYFMCCQQQVKDWMNFWGLNFTYTKDKILPNSILSSKKECMAACLAGLYDTDGHISVYHIKGGVSISINYTTISKNLAEQIQYILLHFGIISTLHFRDRNSPRSGLPAQRVYELMVCGEDVLKFFEHIPLRLNRKKVQLTDGLKDKKRNNSINSNFIPINKKLLLDIVDKHSIGHRYGSKDVEQRKNLTINYVKRFVESCEFRNIQHENISLIKLLIDHNIYYDLITKIENNGLIHTVDINIPENHTYCTNGFISHNTGEKIRGLRANDILNDEFSSINREIFETVIGGFGVVASNPIEVVQEEAKKKINKRLSHKIETKELLPSDNVPNQIIFSGTAYYQFNHFYEYWKKWKAIIKSGGNQSKLEEIFGEEGVPPAFNWKDYSIIRIPYDILPQGLMDDGIIARAKATVNSGVFENEYGAVFSSDSNGFFKRSLIESCVPSNNNQIKLPSGKIDFEPLLVGNSSKKYVFGVDPASEVDNFSIVVLEINRDHRRIVYVWTTTRKSHREALKSGIVEETDYYGYCAAKIRELMKKFPCQHIAMDSQGGGIAVSEALHDLNRLKNDELPIWPIIDPAKEKDTDGESGLHILELVNFASYDWVSEANHGLKKDFEDKICLFPRFDSATIGLSVLEDAIGGHSNGSKLEELIYEIEELKNELAIIVITKTDTGRDRWDTPEVKVSGNKKGRMRKDRYSALLMANMSARKTYLKPMRDKPMTTGGFANSGKLDVNGPEFIGPAWFTENMRNVY